MSSKILALSVSLLFMLSTSLTAAEPPKVGDKAPDFTLKGLDDSSIHLGELAKASPVVVVVLRGWPGYQCPVCDRQTHDFIALAPNFAEAKAKVVFIYPGPAADLKAHAQEFKTYKGKQWPGEFLFAMDPEYSMIKAYGLRWDAIHETAYPSTFVIDGKGTVRFAKISRSHGDRSKAADILEFTKQLKGK